MIAQLLLEEILLGEKKAEDYYAKYGKENLERELDELRKSNQEILSAYPELKLKPDVVGGEADVGEPKSAPRLNKAVFKARPIFLAAAAALALAICLPAIKSVVRFPGSDSSVRLKGSGHHQIRLYKQDGAQAVLLKNGEAAKENDLVQIAYVPGSYSYGVIFSVDGNGNVTRHFPDSSWQAEKLKKTGEEVPLSFAYKLDDAPKYECFVFVASKEPFDFSAIETLDKNNLNAAFLKKGSYLPKDCDGAIFVLNKK